MKNQKGITLVALVITIIVLLILAGVSIAMLTGENGILGRSVSAVDTSKIAEDKEAAALDLNSAYTSYMEAKYVSSTPTTETFSAWLKTNKDTYLTDEAHYSVDATGTDVKITTVHSVKHGTDTTAKTETAIVQANGGLSDWAATEATPAG